MERLTIRNSDGTVSQPTTTSIEALFYRLAAYEDTGLEPEEVFKGKELAEIACGLELLKKYQELGNFDRLRELAEADKEGRCVVLPCKVGDTVWFIKSAFSIAHFPIEAKHVSLRGLSTDGDVWLSAITSYNKISRSFYGSDIGKTVFLTREAAEAALKEREQNE